MIYVDKMQRTKLNNRRNSAWLYYSFCHLTADTFEELCLIADKIGLKYEWIQESRNGTLHFDLTLNKRKLALKSGATEKKKEDLCE